jgi:hypothetical protein
MANVSAVQATWAGGVVGASWGKYWFNELLDATARQAAVDSVRALISSIATAYLRTDWSVQVEGKIQNFDLTTGKLTSETTAPTTPNLLAGGVVNTATYAQGVGARIIWSTGVVINGRKVIGRSFLVPLAQAVGANGQTLPALRTTLAAAITTFVSQPNARPVVWHKTYDRSDPSKPPVYTGGNAVPINGGTVPSAVASLRSRRY